MRRWVRAVIGAAVALAALSGCGSLGEREDAAAGAARRFEAALAGDAEAACGRLAPGTVEELELQAERPCPLALPEERLPTAGAVRRVDVYGGRARVVLDADTLFLASFPGGWKVTAAGCAPQADRPYRCRLKGA